MLRFRLGRIPVEVHPSHWLVAAFLAYSFLPGAGGNGGIGDPRFLTLLLAGMAVVFVSLLVHELGHAVAGLAFGYRPSIQLVWFGGLTRSNTNGPILWWRELLLTAAGPAFGFLLYALARLASPFATGRTLAVFAVQMLLWTNIVWSTANLIPVLPLDGGRIVQIALVRLFGRKGFLAALGVGTVVGLGLAYWGITRKVVWLGPYGMDGVFLGLFFGIYAAQCASAFVSATRSSSSVPQDDPALAALNAANQAMRAQELDRAAALATAVLDREPPAHPEVRSRAHHLLGWVAIKRGEGRRALDHFSQVQGRAVEPAALAAAFSLIGDDERALPLWELAFQQTNDRTVLHEWAGALIRCGKEDRARGLPGVDLSNAYGCAERVLFLRERYSEAASAALKRVELKPTIEAAYDAACALSRAGNRDKAIDLLEKARGLGFDDLRHAATDPDLGPLHGHPRFEALVGAAKTASP